MLDDVWKPCPAESIREARNRFATVVAGSFPRDRSGNTSSFGMGTGTGNPFIRTTSVRSEPEGYAGETVRILASSGAQLTPVAAPFEVRAFSGHPRIGPRESTGEDRCRTDAEGHFAVVLNMRPHFGHAPRGIAELFAPGGKSCQGR